MAHNLPILCNNHLFWLSAKFSTLFKSSQRTSHAYLLLKWVRKQFRDCLHVLMISSGLEDVRSFHFAEKTACRSQYQKNYFPLPTTFEVFVMCARLFNAKRIVWSRSLCTHDMSKIISSLAGLMSASNVKDETGVVYTGCAKVFDVICHEKLMNWNIRHRGLFADVRQSTKNADNTSMALSVVK